MSSLLLAEFILEMLLAFDDGFWFIELKAACFGSRAAD
jgi:hypothetical protein